ncbi:Activating Transcription Factor 7-Interacting Protein 2, partial [Manis pentadactyla]
QVASVRAIGSAAPAGKLSFGECICTRLSDPRSFTRKRVHADTDVRVYVFVHFRFSRTFP